MAKNLINNLSSVAQSWLLSWQNLNDLCSIIQQLQVFLKLNMYGSNFVKQCSGLNLSCRPKDLILWYCIVCLFDLRFRLFGHLGPSLHDLQLTQFKLVTIAFAIFSSIHRVDSMVYLMFGFAYMNDTGTTGFSKFMTKDEFLVLCHSGLDWDITSSKKFLVWKLLNTRYYAHLLASIKIRYIKIFPFGK